MNPSLAPVRPQLFALHCEGVRRLSGCTRDLIDGVAGAGRQSADCGMHSVGRKTVYGDCVTRRLLCGSPSSGRLVLLREQASWVQRMQKALLQMNIQLAEVLTDVMGLTGQAIFRDIVAGQRWSHEHIQEVFPGGPGACGPAGLRA